MDRYPAEAGRDELMIAVCRRAGHRARRAARCFEVGTARGASACAARDRPYDVQTSTLLFIRHPASFRFPGPNPAEVGDWHAI